MILAWQTLVDQAGPLRRKGRVVVMSSGTEKEAQIDHEDRKASRNGTCERVGPWGRPGPLLPANRPQKRLEAMSNNGADWAKTTMTRGRRGFWPATVTVQVWCMPKDCRQKCIFV